MNYILCVVCVSAVALLLASVNAGKYEDDMLRQMATTCMEKTDATEDDLDAMIKKELPETKEGKCLSFCIMNQFNCISDNGDFQQEEFMDLMKMTSENETILAMCDEVSKKCVGKKDPHNNCETAALILKCLEDGAKEAGFEKM